MQQACHHIRSRVAAAAAPVVGCAKHTAVSLHALRTQLIQALLLQCVQACRAQPPAASQLRLGLCCRCLLGHARHS